MKFSEEMKFLPNRFEIELPIYMNFFSAFLLDNQLE